MNNEPLFAKMLDSARAAVTLQLQIGHPLPDALRIARDKSAAGWKVWEQIEAEFAAADVPPFAQGSSPRSVSAPAQPVPSAAKRELASAILAEQSWRFDELMSNAEMEALAALAAYALAELAARESPDA